MLSEVLSEKVIVNKDSLESVRSPILDDINKRILSEPIIRAVC